MKRSKHNLSNYKLLSCNQGQLIPIGLTEILPGDSIDMSTSALIRVSPLVHPVMHPVHVKVHHWFVPHRLVWEDFENFITGGEDGQDASVFPTITMPAVTGAPIGSLADYLGVPTGVASLSVSALPFRGYVRIFNDNYRDQDLIPPLPLAITSNVDATTSTTLQNACWQKDRFTTARPWTQKGPEISIPLTGDADVIRDTTSTNRVIAHNAATGAVAGAGGLSTLAGTGAVVNDPGTVGYNFDPNGTLLADLSGLASVTVNALREALGLQRYEENRARFGSKYVDFLRFLGIKPSDARLQRPEYLGGGKQTIQFSEVLATDAANLGELGGHGIGAVKTNRYRRFFEEHGYIFTLMYVQPVTMYVQGIPRTWNRRIKEDFWQKELEHIGQEEIQNKEVYAAHAFPDAVFGYQDRYDDYRFAESTIAGEFRDTVADDWHMARIFGSAPALNADFVKSNPTDRIYASTSTDQLYIMAKHNTVARRLISRKATPITF